MTLCVNETKDYTAYMRDPYDGTAYGGDAYHDLSVYETNDVYGVFNNTLQHTATHCNTLQHTATHCNTLQHTATHCNALQHTATHCNTLQHMKPYTRQVTTLSV